jgi:hypothetical protein
MQKTASRTVNQNRFLLSAFCFLLSALAGNAQARCSGETNNDPNSGCYTGGLDGASVEFARLTHRFETTAPHLIDAHAAEHYIWMLYNGQVSMLFEKQPGYYERAKQVEQTINTLFPLLKRCVTTPQQSAIKSPIVDESYDWAIARLSIIETFAGSWNLVTTGQLVDVKYPSGDIVRFRITSVGQGISTSDRDVKVMKHLSGMISAEGVTACA